MTNKPIPAAATAMTIGGNYAGNVASVKVLGVYLAANPLVAALLLGGAAFGALSSAAANEKAAATTIDGKRLQIEALTARVKKLNDDMQATDNEGDKAALRANASRVQGQNDRLKAR
ncbi:hypothetical protein LP415_03705 [Polaromonas sp. P1(28)-8]|nr:hypothetical protein LP415_03705 [Polaromonas sp. P1(28)-8]